MTQIIIVLLALAWMLYALVRDRMRPGMILFSVAVFFLCCGIISPREMLEGFSNKGMITVALLFLVSEGVRHSGCLAPIIRRILPAGKSTVLRAQSRMLPVIAFISSFLNNTPVVVIFAPIIKRWAKSAGLPATKFLIPLSYVTILGGMCTLIGTSTNLVVHGMMIEAGYEGLGMFELTWVGLPITVVGILYLFLVSKRLLPEERQDLEPADEEAEQDESLHRVEVVIGARFPGINKRLRDFDFRRHYGADVREVKRGGQVISGDLSDVRLFEGDTVVVMADDSFVKTWGESSVFLMIANGRDPLPKQNRKKRIFVLVLLVLMIAGATIGELPWTREAFPAVRLDMFFFAAVTVVVMAWTRCFPPRKYTKFISWDILITIACAFAISKAMTNSGMADWIADFIIGLCHSHGPYVLLAVLYIITNVITELITNNAAAALAFPLALSIANQLGVDPMPFFILVCVASSACFSSPIGYQTNLIVQGIGNYRFTDFVRVGLPLNLLVALVSILLIPQIWPFEM